MKLLTLSLVCTLLLGCPFHALRDSAGDTPVDIVRRYVGHIHAAQVAQADALWYLEGPPGEELRLRQLSASGYRDKVGARTHTFSYGGIDKGYHRILFEPKEGDDRRSVIFYVRKVDGRWRLF